MRLLTVREVAEALSCSVTHVYNLVRNGEMEAKNIAGAGKRKSWRIPPDALDKFRNREEVTDAEGKEFTTDTPS